MLVLGPRQVSIFYQWVDFLHRQARVQDVQIEWVNLDETSIPQRFHDSRGNLVSRAWSSQPASHNTPLHLRRGSVTFVGLVAASPTLQAALPKIWIGNRHLFPAQALAAVSGEVPPNVYLWRETSSWNTSKLMEEILLLIADSAGRVSPGRQLALLLDCASVHLTRDVLLKAKELNIWVVVVPTGCTHLVQPADTHCFGLLKNFLRRQLAEVQMRSPEGKVSREQWLRCLFDVSTRFMCGKRWKSAFVATGVLGDRTALLSKLEAFGFRGLDATAELPTFEQVQYVLPKASQVSYWDLFAGPLQDVAPLLE